MWDLEYKVGIEEFNEADKENEKYNVQVMEKESTSRVMISLKKELAQHEDADPVNWIIYGVKAPE